MQTDIHIIILLVLIFFAFILGLLCGKILTNNSQSNNASQSFFTKQKEQTTKQNISIDETKYVIDIKTDNLEKKYDNLGDTKQSKEHISSSIDKLKNLKK